MNGEKPRRCGDCISFDNDYCVKRNEPRVAEEVPCNKGKYNYLSALVNGGLRHESAGDKRQG